MYYHKSLSYSTAHSNSTVRARHPKQCLLFFLPTLFMFSWKASFRCPRLILKSLSTLPAMLKSTCFSSWSNWCRHTFHQSCAWDTTFETLIRKIYVPLCAAEHPIRFIYFALSRLPQNLMLECRERCGTVGLEAQSSFFICSKSWKRWTLKFLWWFSLIPALVLKSNFRW